MGILLHFFCRNEKLLALHIILRRIIFNACESCLGFAERQESSYVFECSVRWRKEVFIRWVNCFVEHTRWMKINRLLDFEPFKKTPAKEAQTSSGIIDSNVIYDFMLVRFSTFRHIFRTSEHSSAILRGLSHGCLLKIPHQQQAQNEEGIKAFETLPWH